MRLILLIAAFCISMMSVALAENIQMPPNPSPEVKQATGEGLAQLGPTYYPEFYSFIGGDNPECEAYLKKEFNKNAVVGKVSMEGFSLAPLWVKSKYSGTPLKSPPLSGPPSYERIPGLYIRYEVPEVQRKTANLLITWTVRIEGRKACVGGSEVCYGDAYRIWQDLCGMFHGTSNQRFPGGNVKTSLFVNGVQRGSETVMTIPDGGTTSSYQPADPTQTGSYLLTAEGFGGELPEVVEVEIKWINETSMLVESLDKMRNLIITVVPIEKITK